MTDLARPVAGQPLLDSDGVGTTSTSMIDAAFDLIETNEDYLGVRTSSHIVTTDQYSDIAATTFADGTSLTGWHMTVPDTINGTASISASSSVLTLVTGTWLGPQPVPSPIVGYVGSTIRVAGAGPAGADLQARIVSFQESTPGPFTHANLSVAASTTVSAAVWDFNRVPALVTVGGETAIQGTLKSPNGVLTPTLYVNLTEIGYPSGFTVNGGETISADYLLSQATAESPSTQPFARYAITVASGEDMSGTLVSTNFTAPEIAGHQWNTWYTVLVPVGSLTNIKSIGIKKVLTGGSGSATAQWSLTNIHRTVTTPLDQAYQSQTSVAAVVPPSYPSTAIQQPIVPDPLKSLVDLRPDHAWISGMGGVKNTREWALDETGETNVGTELQGAIDSLSEGDVLTMPPGAAYRCDNGLQLNNPGITIDGCGAALIQGDATALFNGIDKVARTSNSWFQVNAAADRVTIRNLRIFGSSITPQNGSQFTVVAGAPGVSGTTMILDTLNEAVSFTNTPMKDWRGRERRDLVLSDSAGAAGDCVVTVTDDDGVVLSTDALTLTSTPTLYTIYSQVRNIFATSSIKVTKATSAVNNITVHSMRTFNNSGSTWTNTDGEFAHGFDVYADNLTLRNVSVEGVTGDGLRITNSIPTTGVQHVDVQGFMVRGNGRQALALCGGKDHHFRDVFLLYSSRTGVDIEPEFPFGNPSVAANDGIFFRNLHIWKCGLGAFAVSGPEWGRNRNIHVDGMRIVADGGIGGGFMDSSFRNIEMRSATPSLTINHNIIGRNVIWDGVRTDGTITAGSPGVTTAYDEYNTAYTATGLTLRNVQFQKAVLGPYIYTKQIGLHLENIRVSDEVTLDQTAAVGAFQILPDTTYTGLDLIPQRTVLPNSYPGIAIGQPWFPSGLDMKARGLSRVAYLSGGTTKGNNLGRFQESVTAAATSKTIVFPARTYPNVFSITGVSTTGGTLTAGTYHYRFAARNRFGGPVIATSDQTVTIAGTAVNLLIDGIYDAPSGIQIDGLTIYRGPVGGASGNYTMRYDVVPTGDLHAFGGMGTGTSKKFPLTDLGTTVTPWGNNFYQSYTFPVAGVAGSYTPVDETGWEPDVNYAVFVETSWQTTTRISARRRDGFDIEFGVPAPTGSNTLSWMIARF